MQALVAGLIAVIAALVLASRLLSSRFGGISRSDALAAREAAEYGLNEAQAALNSSRYGYLWVTKFDNWGQSSTTLSASLKDCGIPVLDESGNEISPALPEGISSAKNIKTDGSATYRIVGFTPPALPDNDNTTRDQSSYCGSGRTTADTFGNLLGGSAIITVEGTIDRDNNKTTKYRLARTVHVASPGDNLNYSFVILGNAYNATCQATGFTFYKCTPDPNPITPSVFGEASDIAKLNVLDGNLCYGTSAGCSPSSPIQTTVVGCADLDSCIVNNVDTVSSKVRNTYCQQTTKTKKKKKKGVICNSFQQAGDIPNVITLPANQSWATLSRDFKCNTDTEKCEDYEGNNDDKMKFPYYKPTSNTPPTSLTGLTNANLVYGCYFNNTDGSKAASAAGSTAINCLLNGKEIKTNGTIDPFIDKDPNLKVYTSLLPVNIFLWDNIRVTTKTDSKTGVTTTTTKYYAYNLSKGGIENVDNTENGWARLRILGKSTSPRSDGSIPCDQTTVISTKNNDINGAFIWLPNGALNYQKTDTTDSSYAVIWVCKFTAPIAGSTGYKIISPRNINILARENLIRILPGFSTLGGVGYRGYGSVDNPI